MVGLCLVCGERMTTSICKCKFDASKNYDCNRTLAPIPSKIVSTYQLRKNFDKKSNDKAVKVAYAKWEKENATKVNSNTVENKVANKITQTGVENKIVTKIDFNQTDNIVANENWEFEQGLQYYTGSGVGKNYRMAHDFFEKAANKGNSKAMIYLGDMYYGGLGLYKDLSASKKWYVKAASLGDEDAVKKLEERFAIRPPRTATEVSLDRQNGKIVNTQVMQRQAAQRSVNRELQYDEKALEEQGVENAYSAKRGVQPSAVNTNTPVYKKTQMEEMLKKAVLNKNNKFYSMVAGVPKSVQKLLKYQTADVKVNQNDVMLALTVEGALGVSEGILLTRDCMLYLSRTEAQKIYLDRVKDAKTYIAGGGLSIKVMLEDGKIVTTGINSTKYNIAPILNYLIPSE